MFEITVDLRTPYLKKGFFFCIMIIFLPVFIHIKAATHFPFDTAENKLTHGTFAVSRPGIKPGTCGEPQMLVYCYETKYDQPCDIRYRIYRGCYIFQESIIKL